MINEKIRIRLKAFDYRILDSSTTEIVDTARRTGARCVGPIPLPTQISRYTVNRGPHVENAKTEVRETDLAVRESRGRDRFVAGRGMRRPASANITSPADRTPTASPGSSKTQSISCSPIRIRCNRLA